MFGENLEGMDSASNTEIILYMMYTYIMIIVVLNILISIVTDNYDNV